MASTATTKTIYYTVVWGDDEADRVSYADYGDGSIISTTAKARANSCYLNLVRNGVACGFWEAGNLTAGQNLTGGPGHAPALPDDEPTAVEHKTLTTLDAHQNERYVTKSNGSCGRYVRGDTSVAMCSCGWKYHAGSRTEARGAARVHRSENATN